MSMYVHTYKISKEDKNMLQLIKEVPINVPIVLRESWHEKLLKFGKLSSCPYEFTITKIYKNYPKTKETYCICEAEKKGKPFKIAITQHVAKYLLSQEVPDANNGFSFNQYLPVENSQLLITNERNENLITPGLFRLDLHLIELDNETFICMAFVIDYCNGKGFSYLPYFTIGSKKATWKFLFHSDESYMTEYEKMYRDTLIHRSFVIKSCQKLSKYLENHGATEHATLLMKRAYIHDESKISCPDELYALSRIINDKKSLKDASHRLSPIQEDALHLHFKHNSHHPEHFSSPEDMERIDIMEMCCDWHARSTQYNTNFLPFIKERQENRFHFPEWMFMEIWHYCTVLDSDI